MYAGLGRQGCIWAPIIEKAYAICRYKNYKNASYDLITGGHGRVYSDLYWKHTNITIDETGINPDDVISWVDSGSPEGEMNDTIRARAQQFLGEINAQRQLGKGMSLGAPIGFNNQMPLVPSRDGPLKSTYRLDAHIYIIDHVTKDDKGGFNGIVLRNPKGNYFTITNYSRIYFCIKSAGLVEPDETDWKPALSTGR
jgi:hypothetical protein